MMLHADPADWTVGTCNGRSRTITARGTRRHILQGWFDLLVPSGQIPRNLGRKLYVQGVWTQAQQTRRGRFSFRSPLEYTMSLRMRLLLPPPRLPMSAHRNPYFLCSCGSTIIADNMSFYCLDCSCSQFSDIHCHHAVRGTTIDLLHAVSSIHTCILSVLPKEPFVLPPTDTTSFSDLRDEADGFHNTTFRIDLRLLRPKLRVDPGQLRLHHLHQPVGHRHDRHQLSYCHNLLPQTCARPPRRLHSRSSRSEPRTSKLGIVPSSETSQKIQTTWPFSSLVEATGRLPILR